MSLVNRKNDLNAKKANSSTATTTTKRAGRPKNSLAKPKKVQREVEVANLGTRKRTKTRRYSPIPSPKKKLSEEQLREIHESFKNIGVVVKEISKRLQPRYFECPKFPGIVPTAHKKMMKAQAEKEKLARSQPKPVPKQVAETPKRSERVRRPPKKLLNS